MHNPPEPVDDDVDITGKQSEKRNKESQTKQEITREKNTERNQ
jgi:hypothetical protein